MRKITYILVVILLSTSMACDDKLDLTPISDINEIAFYQTEDDFEAAIFGAYSSLRLAGVYGDLQLHGDIRSDDTDPVLSGSVTTRIDFDQYTLTPENGSVQRVWQDNYEGINQVNLILSRLDQIEIDQAIALRIRSEAHFLRANFYFRLVVSFGNIPLITEAVNSNEAFKVPQSTSDLVYNQIISDLNTAKAGLPAITNEFGRVTSSAVSAFIARVYMMQGNSAAAIPELREVISSSANYALQATYSQVFETGNENNDEIIFAVRYADSPGNQNGLGDFVDQQPDNTVTLDLINEYEVGDKRLPITIGKNVNGAFDAIVKFNIDGNRFDGEEDRPIMRYADVLLMLSEALNEAGYTPDGEAFELLNRVRTRDNNLSELTSADIPDQAAFRLAMEHERRVEFVGEGIRWFDLVRNNRYIEVLSSKGFSSITEKDELYPIPQREIDIVGDPTILSQNPLYGG